MKFGVATFKPLPTCEVFGGIGKGTGATASGAAFIWVSDPKNPALSSTKVFNVSDDSQGEVTLSLR